MSYFSRKKPSSSSTNAEATAVSISEEQMPVATMVVDHQEDCYVPVNNPPPTAPSQNEDQASTYPLVYNSDPSFTRYPMTDIACNNCNQQVVRSKVRTYPGWETWTAAGVGFLLFWPLCWLPLVTDSCKRSDHFCTNCGHKLGSVSPFQDCCVETRA